MTLELTTSWTVRGHETSAEIAKYRLKGILHVDRKNCPAWSWKFRGYALTVLGKPCRLYEDWGYGNPFERWFTSRAREIYRWERRK